VSLVRSVVLSSRGPQDVLHRVEQRVPDLVALALRADVDLTHVGRPTGQQAVAGTHEMRLVEHPVRVGSGHRVVAIVPDAEALDEPTPVHLNVSGPEAVSAVDAHDRHALGAAASSDEAR